MNAPLHVEQLRSATALDRTIEFLRDVVLTGDVEMLEDVLLDMDQVECPVVHRFGPGVYIREASMPAGTIFIGHRHRHAHTNMVLRGRAIFFAADGTSHELVAPFFFVAEPGRKVAFVLEDLTMQNIHVTNETDLEKLESALIEKSPSYLRHEARRARPALPPPGQPDTAKDP